MGKKHGIIMALMLVVMTGFWDNLWSLTIVDPHEEPATCSSCHRQQPQEGEKVIINLPANQLHVLTNPALDGL